MTRLTICIYFILLVLSCNQDSPTKTDATTSDKQTPKTENPDQIAKLYERYTKNPQTQAQKDENAIIDYLANQNEEFKRSENGVYVHIKKRGSGTKYVAGQASTADYKGFTLDGKIFDSSYKRGKPLQFKAGQMIPGWTQTQYEVSPGAELTLIVPSHLAYGLRGFPGAVEPNTVIAFDVVFKDLKR